MEPGAGVVGNGFSVLDRKMGHHTFASGKREVRWVTGGPGDFSDVARYVKAAAEPPRSKVSKRRPHPGRGRYNGLAME